MNTPLKQALTLLRDLADMQNGAPLIKYEKEYNELMQNIYDFLNEHEAPIENITEDGKGRDVGIWNEVVNRLTDPEWRLTRLSEMLSDQYQENIKIPQGMHPKTWAFLNEGKN